MRRALLLLLFVAAGCGARAPAVVSPEEELRLAVRGGEVFAANCAACHPDGREGVGPALDRTLHRGVMARQIREGDGIMPPFDEKRIRERDLQALLVYVAGLQKRGERERIDAAMAVDLVDSLLILDLIADSKPPASTITP